MTASPQPLSPQDAIRRFLAELERPAHLLVAISGGSDSTGLLVALSRSAADGVSLHAATIDHGLREESAREAQEVAALCEKLGIPHVTRRWEGEKLKSGISAAAREARYRLLTELAEEIGASAILTGHTLDDQAETVAMRGARSADEADPGLAGMAEAVLIERKFWLLRPFLRTCRADIRAFLQEKGFGWIDDPSNLDPRYERVRMRQRLAGEETVDLPSLDAAAERRARLSHQAASLLADHAVAHHGVLVHLAPDFFAADVAVRRHALGYLAAALGGRIYVPGRESMDRVMAVLDGSGAGRITAGRVIFDRRREGLYLSRENRGLQPLHLIAGERALWDGRYRIANRGDGEIVVGPTAPDRKDASILFPEVPPPVAMRAMAVMPCISAADQAVIQPVLAPFDRFLPQFDYTLAARLAYLLRCDDFPPMRVKVSARKR
ncbi:tRNA lysidine(34) synthetase TilS [Rhizobium sp. LCM 4573]|uniref:tRNA lysidine(34) synthetase TilS n=1 Tax=Rhizobium sp. LCM 4573 TaxID=1848291 RepID=UPI000B31156A|nr:tRNA lysidine(34) synthetase TilS [Rhizobium sp. LCM 4573]